jgi:hypothetical protein
MKDYDDMLLDDLQKESEICGNEHLRYFYLLRCYEAKLSRVEPLSEEFEKTMEGIFATMAAIKKVLSKKAYIERAACKRLDQNYKK